MTAIEVMAIILVVIFIIKMITILIDPKGWSGFVEKVWRRPKVVMVVNTILAVVTLLYLLESGIGIIEIFAVMLFLMFLIGIGISGFSKEIVGLSKKLLKDRSVLKRSWFYIVIWILLVVWAMVELFSIL